MFNSVINETLTLTSVSICIIASIILGLIISIVYMTSSKYSKNFIVTLSLLPLIVSVVIMMVNGNLGTSIAVVGAFSLVRFRSIPGTSKEITAVFLAMAIGLAIGMGQVVFATLITIITSLLMLVLSKTSFADKKDKTKVLRIAIPEDLDYDDVFTEIFKKYMKKYELVKVNTADLGSIYELRYEVSLKDGVKEQTLIDEIRVRNGNLKISLQTERRDEVL